MDPSSPFRAEPKHWADIREWVEANSNASTDHCLWELKQRIEELEARASLVQFESVGPTDQQLKTFACEWWHKFGFVKDKATCTWVIDEIDPQHFVDFLRDALARWCRPTISQED